MDTFIFLFVIKSLLLSDSFIIAYLNDFVNYFNIIWIIGDIWTEKLLTLNDISGLQCRKMELKLREIHVVDSQRCYSHPVFSVTFSFSWTRWLLVHLHLSFLQCWCVPRVSPWTAGAWRRWWRGIQRTSSFSSSRSSGRPERWDTQGEEEEGEGGCTWRSDLLVFVFRFRSSASMSWWLLWPSCSSPHCCRYLPSFHQLSYYQRQGLLWHHKEQLISKLLLAHPAIKMSLVA